MVAALRPAQLSTQRASQRPLPHTGTNDLHRHVVGDLTLNDRMDLAADPGQMLMIWPPNRA